MSHWMAVAVVACCSFVVPRLHADEAALQAYRDSLIAGDFARVESLLSNAVRDRQLSAEHRWRLQLDLAKAQRYQEKAPAALRTLQAMAQADAARPAVRVERAWSLLLTGQHRDALPALESLRGDSDAEAAFTSVYLLARLALEQERFQPCVDLCQQAIDISRRLDFYHNPNAWELRRIQAEVHRLLEAAKDRNVALQYGDDYANYRRGRLLQASGQYKKAIEAYVKIKAPVLADAAGCYIGKCLAELGHADQAAKQWQAFISADEFGLYRGEAIYEFGRLQLLNAATRQHMQSAEVWLRRAGEWCQRAGQQTPKATVESIKQVLQAFPLPEKAATRDRFGNFHRNHVSPETIVNRLTATWYLDDLQTRVALLHAFALHELGHAETKAAMERLIALNSKQNGSLLKMGDVPSLLLADAKDGAFLIPPGAWQSLSGPWAVKLHMACYLLVAGDIDGSQRLFEQVHAEVNGRVETTLEWSVAEFGLACTTFRKGDLSAAIGKLARFETVLRDSPLAPLAVLQAANFYTGQIGGWEDASQRYVWVARQAAGTPLAPRAMLGLAVAAANAGEDRAAAEACQTLLNEYADSRFAPAARTLLSRVKGVSAKPAKAVSTTRQNQAVGRIIPFERHLVLPGSVDFTNDLSQFKEGDMLDYQISYAIRSGCRLSSFWYRLGLFEPQPPPVKKSPLQFFRAPALTMVD